MNVSWSKPRKKAYLIGVGLSLVALIASGCGGGGGSKDDPNEISYIGFSSSKTYKTWLNGQIDIYEKAHPGVTVKVKYTTPTYIIQKIKTAVAGSEAPDVAQMLPGAAQQQLFKAKRILDLTPHIEGDSEWKEWTAGWSNIPTSQYSDGKSVFASSISSGPMYVWYSKSALKKAGWTAFPTTIEGPQGLIALAADLKKAGLPTMATGLNSQALFNYDYTFWTLAANFDEGGVLGRAADQGKASWTAPEFTKAAKLFKRLYETGVFYPEALERNYDPDQKADFGDGKASMSWPLGSWMLGNYPDSKQPDIGVARFPGLDESSPQSLTASNDLEYIIPTVTSVQKTKAHQKLALEFVKQLSSPQSQLSLFDNRIMPVMAEVADQSTSADVWSPLLKEHIALMGTADHTVDENTYGPQTGSTLTNGLAAYLAGNKTVEDLFKEVQAANKQDFPCAPSC